MVLTNAKHEAFAAACARGMYPTDAAKEVGYSVKRAKVTGSELMNRPEIAARVSELSELVTARAVSEAGISKAWVISQLVENVAMAKQGQPVMDTEGNPTGKCKINLPAANRALELIGKELGMFVDRSEVRTEPFENLSDEELDRMIEQLQNELG